MRTLLILLLLVGTARADQWVSPTTKTLVSPNNKWSAVIVPSRDPKVGVQATMGPRGGAQVTITLKDQWMPVDAILLDDGTLLTLDHWHKLGFGDVAILYERDGTVRWSKTLVQLIGQQLIDASDRSVSSIWWRKVPIEWALSKDGKSGRVTLFDENQLELSFKDGSTSIVMVSNLADDPLRQLNRARSLARQDGQQSAALTLLDKMLTKDPENYEAASLYLDVAHRVNDHPLAIAMLDRISPQWKRSIASSYSFANVAIAWSVSLIAVSRFADAERVLKQAALAAPSYANPVLSLAGLLYDKNRQPEADRALDGFLTKALGAAYVDTYAISTIGDFYKQRKNFKKALATYLKGYKKTEITNQFLYLNLAQTYEELGKIDDAIVIHEQLLAYFRQQKLASYIQQSEAELTHLRAKR